MLQRIMKQFRSHQPSTPMPIIVGAPRSGTTLLRFMLDAHSDLAIPPETGFLPSTKRLKSKGDQLRREFFETIVLHPPHASAWHDFGIPQENFWTELEQINPFTVVEGLRTFYRLYASRFNKPRWGDKTPLYCKKLKTIQSLLPEAHFIHIIRDGRDVALSLRQVCFSPSDDMRTLAETWCRCVTTARKHGNRCRAYLEIHYEDLIKDSESVLSQICDFLDLDFQASMLRYYEQTADRLEEHKARVASDGNVNVTHEQRLHQQRLTTHPPDKSRIFAWKKIMPTEERIQYESVAGNTLKEFGY